ncbi:right-handed parallel beta-helix repeat-containing protein [Frigidibacter oleivorans]|uniref:right-handed parallel beta-helix repeat-containing protein n=1 Tax=Frigidibacter oleivorans TaxID=2487129 RepID=UPI0013DEEB05|nr:right-handed parallel beta-helix repeat-containing protein [Frigidibacter oleivorans]
MILRLLPPLLAAFALLPATMAAAADIHVAAPSARPVAEADGSAERPFPQLDAALQAVRGGDRVLLLPGDWPELSIRKLQPNRPVTFRPAAGAQVRVQHITVEQSRNLTVEGLTVVPVRHDRKELVTTDTRSEDITFRNLTILARPDARDYRRWSLDDWLDSRQSGVLLRGPRNTIEDSEVWGTRFAIATTGPEARVERNRIMGFSGDALRGLGDRSVFRGNYVADCVKIDDNHDDGFQSWSLGPDRRPGGGTVRGLVIESNTILEWTGRDHPLRCALQGIGLFDGMFRDTTIRGNLIVVQAYHGIFVSGAIDTTIADNTLVNPLKPGATQPWAGAGPHKNGTPARGVRITGNIAPRIRADGEGVAAPRDANLIATYPAQLLVAPYAGDYHARPGSAATRFGVPSLR